jgi:hypothetical protein
MRLGRTKDELGLVGMWRQTITSMIRILYRIILQKAVRGDELDI